MSQTTNNQKSDKLSVKYDGYRTIMVRIFDDHREDNYREFRVSPKHMDILQTIMKDLKSLEEDKD